MATDYLESGSTTGKAGVLDNLPRIDYTSGSAQLLMEPSRTNLVSISEGIPEATGAVTKTLNYGVAPDSTTSSLKVQKNGVSENDRIIVSDDLAVLDASTYTVSGFVKNIDVVDTGVTTIATRMDTTNTLFRKGYEWTGSSLASTSYGDSGSTSNTILEDYGNGWWRIGFTFTTDSTQLDFEIDIDRQNGSDTTSIETWGWQLEAFQVYDESDVLVSAKGGFVTSYIPTYGVPATRTADGIPAAGAGVQDLSSFFKGDDFTLVVDFADNSPLVRDGSDGGIRLSNGDSQLGAFRIYRNASSETRLRILFDPISGSDIAVEINSDTPKVAIRKVRSTGTFTIYIDGSPATGGVLTDGSFSDAVNYDITSDDFKIWGAGSTIKINSIKLFDEALSNAELVSLTS